MANSTPSTLEILIDIRARLDALNATQAGLKNVTEEASTLGTLFKQGLGIGTGMELAGRAIGILKAAISASIGEAKRFAGQAKDMSEALQITTTDYQVLALEFKNAGLDAGRMTEAISTQTRSLAEARDATSGAAKAYESLGLSAKEVERSPIAERLGIVARAVRDAKDQTLAFSAASQILGSRGLPQLLNALQRLATDGLAKVSSDWEKAGQIISEDAIARIDRAQKKWESFWHSIVVHSAEALAAVQRFTTNDLSPAQGAVLVNQQAMWEQERKVDGKRKQGVQPSVNDTNLLAGLRESFAASALREGSEGNVRAALDAINKITDADRARGALTPLFEKTKADVLEANRLLDIATAKSAERKKAQAEMTAKAAQTQRELTDAENADAEAIAGQEETRLRLQTIFDENNAEWERARAVVEANLSPLEKYNRELDQLRQLRDKIPEGTMQLALDAAKERFDAAAVGEFNKAIDTMSAALQRLQDMVDDLPPAPPPPFESDAQRIRGDFVLHRMGKNRGYDEDGNELAGGGSDTLKLGEGVEAGAQQFVMALGSQGQQVAGALQSTLGTTVSSISEGIYGWATGAQSLGDTLRNLEGSVFKTLLDTVVNMGAQWLVSAALAKTSMISTFLVGVGLRKAEAADTVATEAVKTPSLATNAALASAGSFGLSAVLGIALLAALVGAFAAGGFADGGYTGHGSKHEPAGVVHAGEDVWSQADIARMGGLGRVEALRVGGMAALETLPIPVPARVQPAEAASLSVSSAMAANANAAPQKRERIVAVVDRPTMRQILRDDPDAETVIADVMYRRRDKLV